MHPILNCNKCELCTDNTPLMDKVRISDVMWVGLSAKNGASSLAEPPLSENTNTGRIIKIIEGEISNAVHYKTNLVKCVPLNEAQKLRYPSMTEKEACYQNLLFEIRKTKPKVVVLLGGEVASFVLKQKKIAYNKFRAEFMYEFIQIENIYYIPIHHPSYVQVYKRRQINDYITGVKRAIIKVFDDFKMEKTGVVVSSY